MQENINLQNITAVKDSTSFEIKNNSPNGVQIVAIWIIDPTYHQRYSVDVFLNPGETIIYESKIISLPKDFTLAKIVTDRGNTAVYSPV